tara:strand:+ start:7742 stop:7921 length:180 start_codon:yes stop_codon:yes gene_type:complete
MIGIGILRILTPKVLKAIMSYVFDENELDIKVQVLENRVSMLEKDSQLCGKCNKKIKEK